MSKKIDRILQAINTVNNASGSGAKGFETSIGSILTKVLQKGKGQSKDLYNVRNDDQIDEVNIDIPIIYGEVTTAGQKADGGSKRSSLDPKRTLRQYTLIMSEGKTDGIVGASCDPKLRNCFINGKSILDESLGTANELDVTIKENDGDGNNTTFDLITGCVIGERDPVTNENLKETIKNKRTSNSLQQALNDHTNVNTSPCDAHVLYYDGPTNLWKSKHFNTLLQEAGITVTGGVGGTGGTGGQGGTGGAATTSPAVDTFGCLIPVAEQVTFTTTAPPNNSTHTNSTLLKYTGNNRYMTMSVDPLTKDGINLNFYMPNLFLEKVFSNGVRENTQGSVRIKVCITGSPCGTEAVIAEDTFLFSGNTTTPQNQQRFFQWSQSENFKKYSKATLFPSGTATLYIYRTDDYDSSTDILVNSFSYAVEQRPARSSPSTVDVNIPNLITENSCYPNNPPTEGETGSVLAENSCLNPVVLPEDELDLTVMVDGETTDFVAEKPIAQYTTLSLTGGNNPCPTNDGTAQGAPGASGAAGATGATGVPPTINIPAAPDCPTFSIPTASSSSAIYTPGTNNDMPTVQAGTNLANDQVTVLVTVAQGNGTIGGTPTGSAAITNNNSKAVTIAGPVADVNTVLDNLVYSSSASDTGDVRFDATVTDSAGTSETITDISLLERSTESAGATGSLTITPSGTGDLTALNFDTVSLLNGTVTSATATTIKDAINAKTTVPNFTATESAGVVTVTAPLGFGEKINKKGFTGTTTGTLALSMTLFSGGAKKTSKNTDKFGTSNEAEVQGVLTNTEAGQAFDAIYFPNVASIRVEYPQDAEHSDLMFLYRGKHVATPTGYSDTGVHPSSWNYASFTEQYSNNPAWIFWDWLTNERYGLGNDIVLTAANQTVLLQDLFEASAHNNQSVNSERRFTCNTIISGSAEKLATLDSIASTMNAKTYWYKGQLRLWQDRAGTTERVVNQTNTQEIAYTGASSRSLTNFVTTSFNSPQKMFKEDSVVSELRESIVKTGPLKKNVFAFGCTSRNQAVRYGNWIIHTDKTNVESVRYIAGLDHYDAQPGQIVSLEDSNRYTANRRGVRITSVLGTGITLDSDTGLSGVGNSIDIQLEDGTVHSTTITLGSVSNGQQSATLGSSTSGIAVGAVANIYTTSNGARLYRITDVHELDGNRYEVSAVFYDPNKYTIIEQNIFTGNT